MSEIDNQKSNIKNPTFRIAVFDVCGTITRTNNTSDFLAFVLRRDRSWRYVLLVLIRVLASLCHHLGVRSPSGQDLLRAGQIALLRGYSEARLRERAEQYADKLFARDLLNRQVVQALEEERKQGRTVFVVSSALDPPIEEIAKRLKVEHCFCSELELHEGRCTGRLKTDLLGRKESILARLPADVDWQDSASYSDNVEDAGFLAHFGRRRVVLNTATARRAWDPARFQFLVNYEHRVNAADIHAVNERTLPWVYLPSLYYVISRFHRQGVVSLFLREVVPVTLVSWLFTGLGARAWVLMPLSFWMFYAVYDLGGLVNDLAVSRELPQQGGTRRLAPQVHVHPGLFLAIRVALVGPVLAWLSRGGYPVGLYLGALLGCLAVSFLHTLILSHRRLLTFLLLKICRNSIPLLILASQVPPARLAYLCAIFSALDVPWRVCLYGQRRGLVGPSLSIPWVRWGNTALLWGIGAGLALLGGSPLLLVIASYYLVLDGLGILLRRAGGGRLPARAGPTGDSD